MRSHLIVYRQRRRRRLGATSPAERERSNRSGGYFVEN
jgi:hypothetical protein